MAYVLVQHLDPAHKSLLTDLLARATQMEVHEARNGLIVEADHVYVIPPNTDMTLSQSVLTLVPKRRRRGGTSPLIRFCVRWPRVEPSVPSGSFSRERLPMARMDSRPSRRKGE